MAKLSKFTFDPDYACVLIPESPEVRALRAKGGYANWSTYTASLARDAFAMTSYFIVFAFELMFGKTLAKHPRFRIAGSTGVKLCCPWHLTTEGVITPTDSTQQQSTRRTNHQYRRTAEKIEILYGDERTFAKIDGEYHCSFWGCPAVVGKYRKKGFDLPTTSQQVREEKMTVPFLSSSDEVLATMPREIQLLYAHFVWLPMKGIGSKLFTRVMMSEQEWATLHREIGASYDAITSRRMEAYALFTKSQEAGQPGLSWPPWMFNTLKGPLAMMGIKALTGMIEQVDQIYAAEIKADMLMRIPYAYAKFDATFEGIGISMGGEKAETLIISAIGDILMHVETTTESFKSLIPMFMRLAKRLNRLTTRASDGTVVPAMSLLIALYGDRCCEGMSDPSKHPVCYIFDNVKRAPLGDPYHACAAVVQTLNQGATERMEFASKCGRRLRPHYEPVDERGRCIPCDGSVQSQVNYLMKVDPELDSAKARDKAKSTDCSAHVWRYGPAADVLVGVVDELIAEGEEIDKKKKLGERRLFRPAALGGETSTLSAFERLRACCAKGCLTDLEAIEKMHLIFNYGPNSGLPQSISLGGTHVNENEHKNTINKPLKFIHRMTQAHRDLKVRWNAYFSNWRNDVKLGLLGNHLSHLPPFIKIRLRALYRMCPISRVPFEGDQNDFVPPLPTSETDEPAGMHYVENDAKMMAEFEALVVSKTERATKADAPARSRRKRSSAGDASDEHDASTPQCWFSEWKIYVFTDAESERRSSELLDSAPTVDGKKILAVDIEWTAGRQGPQIPDVVIFNTRTVSNIVHVAKIGFLPEPYKRILQDGNVRKVGLNFQGDITRLKLLFPNDLDFDVCCWVDISHLAKGADGERVGLASVEGCWSLANLLRELVGQWLDKDLCSGPGGSGARYALWNVFPLVEDDRQYCGNDGKATLLGYLALRGIGELLPPRAPPAAVAPHARRSATRAEASTSNDMQTAGPLATQAVAPAAPDASTIPIANVRAELKKRNICSLGNATVVRERLAAAVDEATHHSPPRLVVDDDDGQSRSATTDGTGQTQQPRSLIEHTRIMTRGTMLPLSTGTPQTQPQMHHRRQKQRTPHLDDLPNVEPTSPDELALLTSVWNAKLVLDAPESTRYSTMADLYNTEFRSNAIQSRGLVLRGPTSAAILHRYSLSLAKSHRRIHAEHALNPAQASRSVRMMHDPTQLQPPWPAATALPGLPPAANNPMDPFLIGGPPPDHNTDVAHALVEAYNTAYVARNAFPLQLGPQPPTPATAALPPPQRGRPDFTWDGVGAHVVRDAVMQQQPPPPAYSEDKAERKRQQAQERDAVYAATARTRRVFVSECGGIGKQLGAAYLKAMGAINGGSKTDMNDRLREIMEFNRVASWGFGEVIDIPAGARQCHRIASVMARRAM